MISETFSNFNEEFVIEPVNEKKVDLAKHLFTSLEKQVEMADRKVQAIFGLNAFLVAAISLQSQQKLDTVLDQGFDLNTIIDLTLKAIFLMCSCLATWSAVKAVSPRVHTDKNLMPNKKSLFYFDSIQSQKVKDFTQSFMTLNNKDAINELLESCHAISGILNIKYKFLKRSTSFISIALFTWVLMQVNKFLI
jgi:hypothetical protein